MISRWLLVVLLLPSLGVLGGCGFQVVRGSGKITSEERAVSDFSALDFSGFGEMTIIQGDTEGLTIETDDNLLPLIESNVRNGVLTIRVGERGVQVVPRPTDSIRFTLHVKELNALDMSGAGQITAEALTAPSFALTHSGAGQVNIDVLSADDLAATLSGAGEVNIGGKVSEQTVELSGLGNYAAGDLESQSAEVVLSGAGSATLWVTEQLDATLSGAGSIRYYGSPQVSQTTSGLGKIEGLGAK
jgi:hypothetical protein